MSPLEEKKFQWGDLLSKAVMAQDALNHYPDPTKPYDIQTDACDLQVGAVVVKKRNVVACWCKKLSSAQPAASSSGDRCRSIACFPACLLPFKESLQEPSVSASNHTSFGNMSAIPPEIPAVSSNCPSVQLICKMVITLPKGLRMEHHQKL